MFSDSDPTGQIAAKHREIRAAREKEQLDRTRFFGEWGPDRKSEIAAKLDKHSFSYSDLSYFVEKPYQWLDEVLNDKKREHEQNDSTTLGNASHMIIEDYFEARENILRSHKSGENQYVLTDAEKQQLGVQDGRTLVERFDEL